MYKLNKIIPNIVLAAILAIAVIVCLLFYLGGDVDPTAEILEPVHTNLLLNYTYVLLFLVFLVTVASAVIMFVTKLIADPKSAMIVFIGVGALALLMILTYALGDVTPLNIPGFDGEQTAFDLKLTNMSLYSSYILFGIAVVVSSLSFLSKRIF